MPFGAIGQALLLLGAAYGALVLLVFFTQASLLYYPNMPSRELHASPEDIGLAYEEVRLTTDDGVELHGWFVPAPAPRATLLFFHGNAGNISHRLDSLKIFHDLGLNTLIIDYRGYGKSAGSPSEQGTHLDAQAAWIYLTQQRGTEASDIILFGRSLGAAVAARLASEVQPRALIVESAFTSVPDLGAEVYPFLPVRLLSRFHYPARDYIARAPCPTLIVHSRDDEIIPFHHGAALFALAREPKQLLELRGGHNDGFLVSLPAYREGLADFLSGVLTPQPSS